MACCDLFLLLVPLRERWVTKIPIRQTLISAVVLQMFIAVINEVSLQF
jgi:hypothetical protein